jgi:penicillin-binding protein 1C
MPREAAFIISDILSDRAARSLTFGYENPLSTRYWTAVKTGTSKDMRDNWCVGFSDRYTVGVWVGNFSGEPMWNVSGISGAAPVWLEVMNYLHRSRVSSAPRPPAGVSARDAGSGQSSGPGRREWFITGTEPANAVMRSDQTPSAIPPRISYPPDGTIMAIDPDIPADNSLVFFEASSRGQFDWVLNNVIIGKGTRLLSWKPEYGKYELSLIDHRGRIIDSVNFEVRGRPPDSPRTEPAQKGE